MKYLLLLLPLLISAVVWGQGMGQITGKVVDSINLSPVDYAAVSIFKEGKSSPFNGSSTDAKGSFVLDKLSPGYYKIIIDFVGYQRKTIDNILIPDKKATVSLGNIWLLSSSHRLQEVTINGQKAIIENKIDKIVYNTANDITSQGGVALDVLKKVPQVSVDIDGNVEVQGNSNIRFLINGKPSSIFGASLADALQSIPASQIKNIELITSPSAKYDASGTGGIINIILKDNNVQGINGSINLSAGSRLENGSFSLNARKGNFGAGAFLNGNEQLYATTLTDVERNSVNDGNDTFSHLLQKGNNRFRRQGYQTGLTANWNITPHNELNASMMYNSFGNNGSGVTAQQQTSTDMAQNIFSDLVSIRDASTKFHAASYDFSVGYKKTFAQKDRELDIVYTITNGDNLSAFSQQQVYSNNILPASGVQANNPGKDQHSELQIDYAQPVNDRLSFETGGKFITENINNSTVTDTMLNDGSYIMNANQSYSFTYNRHLYASYISASFSLFNKFLDIKAGLRYERTVTIADFAGINIPSYDIWVPSYILSHKLDESQTLKLSYSYRIERPDYGNLNPFYNVSDPHNITSGNPVLKPEIGHRYELGYNKTFKKGGNLYVSAVYRYNTDDIQAYTTFYPTLTINGTAYTDVSVTQRYNLGSEVSTGGNIYLSLPVGNLDMRSNMFLAERINNNPGSPQTSGFMARITLNACYKFGNDLAAEAFGNYRSPMRTIQGQTATFVSYTLAVRKLFWDKKASLGITITEPFSRYIDQRTVTSGEGFDQVYLRQVPYRSFGITATYKFGKLAFKGKDKDDNEPQMIEN